MIGIVQSVVMSIGAVVRHVISADLLAKWIKESEKVLVAAITRDRIQLIVLNTFRMMMIFTMLLAERRRNIVMEVHWQPQKLIYRVFVLP